MAKQTTKDDTTKDPAAKRAALALIARGLITQAEGARMAGVSRQLMRHWASEIDIDKARDSVLARLWRTELSRGRKAR